MRLKLSVRRHGADPVDVVITADPDATVGDVARRLIAAQPAWLRANGPFLDPHGAASDPAGVTLRVEQPGAPDTGHATLADPDTELARSGLRSGLTVAVVAPDGSTPITPTPAAARVTVEAGPDRGLQHNLGAGTATIGRGPTNDIALTDPMTSKVHARLDVGDIVELVDRGSVNGLVVDGRRVERAVLADGDRVLVGDSLVRIDLAPRREHADPAANPAFNRSPRLDPRHPAVELEAPNPPAPRSRLPWPFIAFLAPVAMAAVLYAFTRQVQTILFVALSPLLIIGTVIEQRLFSGRAHRRAVQAYHRALTALDADLARRGEQERRARGHEHPSLAEAAEAVVRRDALLWTRRPDRPGFLTVRAGLARLPSRTTVARPHQRDAEPSLLAALDEVIERHRTLDGLPAVIDLAAHRNAGVAGVHPAGPAVAAGLLTQLVALHSPAELVVCALVAPRHERDWSWLRWLPHTSSEHSPIELAHLADSATAAAALLGRLADLVEERSQQRALQATADGAPALPCVVVLVDDDAPFERSRAVALAEAGPAAGVHLLWLAPSLAQLPAACGAYLDVAADARTATLGFIDGGVAIDPVLVEPVDPATAEHLARTLAPLQDAGAPLLAVADLPRSVPLLSLLEPGLAGDPAQVLDRWRQSASLPDTAAPTGRGAREREREQGLRATVGLAAEQALTLDLRVHGPHALVGGTTGAGKSEFLQSWVAALAASYSPARLTFLFVDYKGGSAFRACAALPHAFDVVTDLTPHLVQRALRSLDAELRHRERILERHRAKDIVELERRGEPDTPPSLLIVVDEFAALVQEVPEFVDGVVNVAQRGRSLGLHLILATQRPAGVIRENLRANTNLRIALRMADADDSDNVIGSGLAATFDPAVPGRAVAKLGPGRLVPFQSGYVGGVTDDGERPAEVAITELAFGEREPWQAPEAAPVPTGGPAGRSDLDRLVATIGDAFRASGLGAPRRPWLKELAAVYDLARLRHTRTDAELPFGVLDDPAHQTQSVATFVPDRDGNLVVFGTGGSGKTTLLRTLAVSAGLTQHGGPCHVYGIDFGARGLSMLEPLPHVGAIVNGDDHERLTRLLRHLRATIDERAARFAAVQAGSIAEYRQAAGRPAEPRLLLLLDGISAFRTAYEAGDRIRWQDLLHGLATDGRLVGVHLVVTADRTGALTPALASAIPRRVVLRLAGDTEYAMAGLGNEPFAADSPPGRAFVERAEVQVAVLGGSANVAVQARAIEQLAQQLRPLGGAPPQRIGRLAERVTLAELPLTAPVPGTAGAHPVLGIADEDLAPVGFVADGPLLLVGPPASGRTATAAALALSYRRAVPGAPLYYLGGSRSPLWALQGWTDRADGADAVQALAERLSAALASHRDGGPPAPFIVIDQLTDLAGGLAEDALGRLVKAATAARAPLVAEIEVSAAGGYSPLLQALRALRHGIALQPDQIDGEQVFKTPLPRLVRNELPPGRGFYLRQGRALRVQCALPELT